MLKPSTDYFIFWVLAISWCHIMSLNVVNIASGNVLLPDNTERLELELELENDLLL